MSWPIYVIMTVVIFIHNNEPFLKYIIYVKNLGAIHDLVLSLDWFHTCDAKYLNPVCSIFSDKITPIS